MKLILNYQGYFLAPDDESYKWLQDHVQPKQDVEVEVSGAQWRQRTSQQNKAMHQFFKMLAKAFNDAGCDQRAVMAKMKEGVEVPWSEEAVKSVIWKGIQDAILGKDKTSELTPEEVSKVYEVVNRFTTDRFNVHVPFPDRFGPING